MTLNPLNLSAHPFGTSTNPFSTSAHPLGFTAHSLGFAAQPLGLRAHPPHAMCSLTRSAVDLNPTRSAPPPIARRSSSAFEVVFHPMRTAD